jgi:hypothetical protein
MSIDSEAVFADRVHTLRLSAHLSRFTELGWLTYADLAFSTSYVPGQGDDARFLTDVALRGLGDAAHKDLAGLRRLFFEAFSLAAADLRRKVEVGADDAPRKVPAAERHERRVQVERRLLGLSLTGELDISNRLLDSVIQMAEDNVLRYIPWEECTARTMEMYGHKRDNALATGADGSVKLVCVERAIFANTDNELRVQFALKRRGLALEMADLADYLVHDKLVDKLLAALLRDVPVGHRRVDLAQIERADREAFRLMAQVTRAGIRRSGAEGRPLDLALAAVLDDPDFRTALQPLQGAGKRPPADAGLADHAEKKPSRMTRKAAFLKLQSLQNGGVGDRRDVKGNSKGKGRGKGSGKGIGKDGATMPNELSGMLGSVPGGPRICWDYNLARGCSNAPPGTDECPRGVHICCRPGCGGNHSLQDCPGG